MSVKGYISSVQSMGTLDGPGVRFVAFLQGCNLRCGCCHNPETQELSGGEEYYAVGLVDKAERFRAYFGKDGGITLSGGEPLVQAEFVCEVFEECKSRGINTCIDTSGSIINDSVEKLLNFTDRALLDIKYSTDEKYRKYVGCSIDKPLSFLELLEKKKIPTTIRQVIIPSLNDDDENILFLKGLKEKYTCIDAIELLPFKKICKTKYDNMGRAFPFENFETPSAELMKKLEAKL